MKLKREQQVYSEPGRFIGWHIQSSGSTHCIYAARD